MEADHQPACQPACLPASYYLESGGLPNAVGSHQAQDLARTWHWHPERERATEREGEREAGDTHAYFINEQPTHSKFQNTDTSN